LRVYESSTSMRPIYNDESCEDLTLKQIVLLDDLDCREADHHVRHSAV
jgi:hypothetical protein